MNEAATHVEPVAARVRALDWPRIASDLDARGYATTGALLTPAECAELIALYPQSWRFRSRVVMGRHGYGSGEYQYFAYPLPPEVQALRAALYSQLATIAARWNAMMKTDSRFPPSLAEFTRHCHAVGQTRPTPLLLKYGVDDYNRMHQDRYGPVFFPLQMALLLSCPQRDFAGGEFLLSEQRPRMQSQVEVVPLSQGEGVIFAGDARPEQGAKGMRRVRLRHGVSRIRAGERFTLGVILHDAA